VTSFNTGAQASTNTSASVAPVIPAGVLAGDVMLLCVQLFTTTGTPPVVSFSGGGGGWTQIGATQVAANAGVWNYGSAWYRVATAGDPGATLTISETGSPAASTWWAVALAAYTAANTGAPADVNGGAQAAGAVAAVTCPALSTGVAGDWAVFMGGGGVHTTITGPAGSAQRENVVSSAQVGAGIWDSNSSAGPAGTSIGGGTISTGAGTNWLTAFTIGLAPPPVPVLGLQQQQSGRSMMRKRLMYSDV